MKNIQNTMSDRAGTEKNFNRLLEEFRKEVLPQVVDNWDALTENQQKPISAMNNLFCGLHLLVGMVDVAEESLKKFQRNFLDGKLIGSAAVPELKMYHRQESGTLELLRTSSKAFAVGEGEKNGVSLFWKTYLNEKRRKILFKGLNTTDLISSSFLDKLFFTTAMTFQIS